jgi:hypothetical protein
MYEQENQAHYQPDYRQGVEDALEEEFQLPVLSFSLQAALQNPAGSVS